MALRHFPPCVAWDPVTRDPVADGVTVSAALTQVLNNGSCNVSWKLADGSVGNFNFEVFKVLSFWTAIAAIMSVMLSDFFDTMGTAFGHLEEDPPDPRAARSDLPPAFGLMVLVALAKLGSRIVRMRVDGVLRELMRLLAPLKIAGDAYGLIFEFFMGEFATAFAFAADRDEPCAATVSLRLSFRAAG